MPLCCGDAAAHNIQAARAVDRESENMRVFFSSYFRFFHVCFSDFRESENIGKNNPKMMPKSQQHDPKTIPKRSQNDPKRFQNDPKMTQHIFQNDLKLFRNDPKMIPKLIE